MQKNIRKKRMTHARWHQKPPCDAHRIAHVLSVRELLSPVRTEKGFVWACAFISPAYTPAGGMSGSRGNFMFNHLKKEGEYERKKTQI